MKIKSVKYIKSLPNISFFDMPPLPAISFIGRSNVGKSSLINNLINRKNLVKTSSTPGKTQLLNYFLVNEEFYFVDLPGYGFAKVPDKVRRDWNMMVKEYLLQDNFLKLTVHLIDIRHKPTNQDLAFQEFLSQNSLPSLLIANKSDKLNKNQQAKSVKEIKQAMNLSTPPLPHSVKDTKGKEEIWKRIEEALVRE